ncbi:MAG: hypothetical protein O9325_02645 [Roseomonas sp.]|nr:hypothetical protein [Roseomonas sp.]
MHSHGWATEPPPSVGELLRPATARVATTRAVTPDELQDDGLVHAHGWATGERNAR